jgi:hypothetical protein
MMSIRAYMAADTPLEVVSGLLIAIVDETSVTNTGSSDLPSGIASRRQSQ